MDAQHLKSRRHAEEPQVAGPPSARAPAVSITVRKPRAPPRLRSLRVRLAPLARHWPRCSAAPRSRRCAGRSCRHAEAVVRVRRDVAERIVDLDPLDGVVRALVTADGLDYNVSAQPAAPLGALQPLTTSYWYDGGRRGDVRILFENLATIPSRVHIIADFTDASTVASLLTNPRFEDINAFFGSNYIRGAWTGRVQLLD